MLDSEGQWTEALMSNNIRAIVRWLSKLTAEGDAGEKEILQTFSCWMQRSSEVAKKELLTMCLSHSQGRWMFLDRNSFSRVHVLLQRLRNLLTLAQWTRRHLWNGVRVPCLFYRDTYDPSDGCWNQEHRALKQHIWLGRLIQWWGIMGLLPKFPEAQELKRITQMWKEMDHRHRKAYLDTQRFSYLTSKDQREQGGFCSLIEGMVAQLDRQHGCIWPSENYTDQGYPPPSLQALLRLVLVPRIDNVSVQAILMYFILDVMNFLQCRDDLLQSFCRAFTIPPSFSQQIRAFWKFDHGHIKASMELLLSPRAAVPWQCWQHRCIIQGLLTRKQPWTGLRYLQWARPAIETIEDAKLYADVLLQSSCVSDAWVLLKRCHSESEDMVMYFLQACERLNLCVDSLKYIPEGCNGEGNYGDGETTGFPQMTTECCPLSARLYQAQKTSSVSPDEFIRLVRKAVMEVRNPPTKISEVVWPKHSYTECRQSTEMFLSAKAVGRLTPSPSPLDTIQETDDLEEEQPVIHKQQHEMQEHISSEEEDLSSVSASSFSSASPLPLLKQHHPYVYESTLTLQKISSLLTDGENQCGEGEEVDEEAKSGTSSSDALPDCPELILTLDGATAPIFLSSINTDSLVDRMLSAGGSEERGMDMYLDVPTEPWMEDNVFLDTRSDFQPQFYSNEGDQSMPDISLSHTGVTPLWSSSVSFNQESQPDCIPSQIVSAAEPPHIHKQKLHQDTHEHYQQEETGCFNQELACMPSESNKNLTDLHQSFRVEEPIPRDSAETVEQDNSLLGSTFPSYLISYSPDCSIKVTSVPADRTSESSLKSADELSLPSTSTWLDHCRAGGWWKQGTEARRASTGLLSVTQPGAGTSDKKRSSLVLSQPYSLVNFTDKGDNRDGNEVENIEAAGWSGLLKASQGAIRSGRIRSRSGKRGNRK